MNSQTRLQWLEIQLDREDLTQEQFIEYNTEANALQSEINAIKAQRENDRQSERHAKIAHITQLAKEGKMVELVESYGAELEADYVILENFTVLSGCFNPRNPNAQNVWECRSIEEALAKKFQLIYWRLYNRYVRNSEVQ
jgi:hypothetical protein